MRGLILGVKELTFALEFANSRWPALSVGMFGRTCVLASYVLATTPYLILLVPIHHWFPSLLMQPSMCGCC